MSWTARPPHTRAFSGANVQMPPPRIITHWATECQQCGAFLDIEQAERPANCPKCGADISDHWRNT